MFPSGLVLANTRATFEAFFSSEMVFHRTLRPGERYAGGWRGVPELSVGVLVTGFAFMEQAWSVPFFAIALAGLFSIGAMGFSGSAPQQVGEIAPRRIRSGE